MSAAQEEFKELMRDKGRRSQHPEDDIDRQSFLNISDDDDPTPSSSRAFREDDARQSMNNARTTIPNKRFGANTGPKGVISDAQDFRDSRRSARMSARNSMESTLRAPEQPRSGHVSPALEALEDEDEDAEMDDDFMRRWRESRLQEMQHGSHKSSSIHGNGRPSRRLYGGLATVDGEGYLEAVDKSDPDTVVVVYIYDDYVSYHCRVGAIDHMLIMASRKSVIFSRIAYER